MTDSLADRGPALDRGAYDCPHCGAFSQQRWSRIWGEGIFPGAGGVTEVPGIKLTKCENCERLSIWVGGEMVMPSRRAAPVPHPDMPDDVRQIYEEARAVSETSRRSAAALLRLGLQMLVDDLETGSGDINAKIGRLVQRGLMSQVQRAMDVLRVVGNNAVHPGQIDLSDDPALVPSLFNLINLIVEQVLTRPKHVDVLFESLPQKAREAISRRDAASA